MSVYIYIYIYTGVLGWVRVHMCVHMDVLVRLNGMYYAAGN